MIDVQKESLALTFIEIILGVALVGGLVVGGWTVYRRLPADGATISFTATDRQAEAKVIVILHNDIAGATLNSPVELYPFDLAAAQREFQATPRLARQFDDFLLRRMHGIAPVKATTEGQGRAAAMLKEGNWWLHATASFANGETIEWRLPVNVIGREQTVELTMDNAYERTKKF